MVLMINLNRSGNVSPLGTRSSVHASNPSLSNVRVKMTKKKPIDSWKLLYFRFTASIKMHVAAYVVTVPER